MNQVTGINERINDLPVKYGQRIGARLTPIFAPGVKSQDTFALPSGVHLCRAVECSMTADRKETGLMLVLPS